MRYVSPKLFFLGIVFTTLAIGVSAQDAPPPPDGSQFEGRERKPNLIENLGLSPEQIRQIRIMNRARKPLMEAAQLRLREANRALDMAIYGDALDEEAVRAKLKEFQQAQGEVAGIRFESEVELRKILSPEQLVRFRGLRARAAETRQKGQRRRKMEPGTRPVQRIRQLPNRQPVN